MRRRRPIRRKNESKTFLYLQELLPQVPIEREVVIREPIYAPDGKLIRHFIMVDFRFFVNNKDGVIQETIVEYDGSQHFKPAKRFGGLKTYEQQVVRDDFLKSYCVKNNIRLINLDGRVLRGQKILHYLESVL